MKNEIFLNFCIWGFEDIDANDITSTLSLTPSKIYTKGEKNNPKFNGTAKQNGWLLSSRLNRFASFEDQMNDLLDIIEPKIDLFRPLCEKYYCEFSCALFIHCGNEESTPWIHLNSRYNAVIKELNIEFDIDLYILPDI